MSTESNLSKPPGNANTRAVPVFVLLSVAVVAAVGAYAMYARGRGYVPASTSAAASADPAQITVVRGAPHVLFRITALGPSYGRVALVPLDKPGGPPVVTPIACDRVYASAEHGLCLQAARGVLTTYRAVAFDSAFNERHTFTLAGAPSRTRVAPAAPLAASTVFVSGDSYAAGGFSTRTTIFDLRNKSVLGDLESFTVTRDGQPFKRQDFNFWGVTFRKDGDRFFATLGTGGRIHLVDGTVSTRTMTVIGDDVECPALSPDGSRLVYKARMIESGRVMWRLRIREVASGAVTQVPETRNVDDQAEWLDDSHVLYALPREAAGSGSSDIWVSPAGGTGTPRIFIADAFSPAVVR